MRLFDLVRFAGFLTFGVGIGFMLITNVLAFQVLWPPKKLGFLWWHVTSISLAFICIGIVATERIVGSLGDPPGWRSVLVLSGMTLNCGAQFTIFKVERARLIHQRAVGKAAILVEADERE